MLAARIRSLDYFAVAKIVVGVDAIDEQHAWFCTVVCVAHDLAPNITGLHCSINETSFPICTHLHLRGIGGFSIVNKIKITVIHNSVHELIGYSNTDVEVRQGCKR